LSRPNPLFGQIRPWNGENLVSHAEDHEGTRRDFLYYATAGAGVVTAGAAIWPLVNQMNPSADVQALASIRVDVSGVEPGTQLTVKFLGKPVFIRRRTEAEIAEARAVELNQLPDQNAQNRNDMTLDASDQNRTLDEAGEWLVMIGVCTHLGCVPMGDGAGDFGGWFCPCHGSHYDSSGRIRRGPAPENLWIPVAVFEDDTTILLG
jgi:ubiquinol-cytochrome c reductase iron-sulfur subunit